MTTQEAYKPFHPGDLIQHRASGELGVIIAQDQIHKHRWWVSIKMNGDEQIIHQDALKLVEPDPRRR